MDAPEQHPGLHVNYDRVGWEWFDPSLIRTDGKYESNEPVKVGALAGEGGGRNVFVNRIPAVKAADVGYGGRSHLVAQRDTDGRIVVRRLSRGERDRLCEGLEGFDWGDDDMRAYRQGNSGPPAMMSVVLRGLHDFLRPHSNFVPEHIDQIISPEDAMAFRGSLVLAEKDYGEMKKRGLIDQKPGLTEKKKNTHNPNQQKGGYAFNRCVP